MNSGFDMFQNSGYVNNRNRKRTLILDVDDSATADIHLGAGIEFNIPLHEPLIIDKHSEIYLDNFLSFNSNIGQTPSRSAFVLQINEFNMNSNVASSSHNNNMFNSLIIPNDHKTVDNNHSAVVHKGKKFNYVCDINPQTISSISGKITDLAGEPIFHGVGTANIFTYTLTGIDAGNLGFPVVADGIFTGTTGFSSNFAGQFLVTHSKNAQELHFSSNTQVTLSSGPGAGHITFTGCSPLLVGDGGTTSGTLTLTNDTGKNPDLHLLRGVGRFIAEFSIISRE
tara:strand:+ start:460 stop:1308 length:849 start_codon:yes stop_codon:yes gene_type:complete